MAHLTMRLFGAPQVMLDDVVADWDQRKPLALLAYLAVTSRRHTRDALAALLWPDYGQARTYLRSNLSMIRQALGDSHTRWLSIDREGVEWRRDGDAWLDAVEFQGHVSSYRAHRHVRDDLCSACADRLSAAAALYADDFLAGFTLRDSPAFDEWSFFQREQLRSEFADILAALTQFHSVHTEFAAATSYGRRWLALDPLHEPAHRRLMRIYAASGQRALAVRQYGECARILREELSAAPDAETEVLYDQIRRRQVFGVAVSAAVTVAEILPDRHGAPDNAVAAPTPAASTPGPPPNNLPAPLTPLVGRGHERDVLLALLRRPEVRLVTLTGMGGVGKTRLSQQVAADSLVQFPDGVYFISLAPIREPNLVASVIAVTLGVREAPNRPLVETLMTALADKRLLLVLDNFEHIVSAAPIVTDLLRGCPRLKALVTSREALHLSGEHEFMVAPLPVPLPNSLAPAALAEFAAIELFRQRAVAAQYDFVLDAASAPVVAELCVRLDGLPLAIELAAARVKHLSPQAMLARFGQDPVVTEAASPALSVLRAPLRDVPQRHRSLRDAIAWSYALLDEDEQKLFRRLAVFAGGWTVDAAQVVCGHDLSLDMLDGLASLMDKHLVQRATEDASTPRFVMLETLRGYGLEQLRRAGEAPDTWRRMADFYLRFAEAARGRVYSHESAAIQQTMSAEWANLRAVFHRARVERQAEVGLRLSAAIHPFWLNHPREAAQTVQAALDVAADSPPSLSLALALACAGYFANVMGDEKTARDFMLRSLALRESVGDVRDPLYPSVVLGILAWIEFYRGEYARAEAYHAEQLAHETRAGHSWAQAMTLNNIGNMHALLGRYDRAQALLEEALRLHRRVGHMWGLAKVHNDLAALAMRRGDFGKAGPLLAEGQALCERTAAHDVLSGVKRNQGLLAMHMGDYRTAAASLLDALARHVELGSRLQILGSLDSVAELALRIVEPQRALRLAAATTALRREVGLVLPPIERAAHEEMIRQARDRLDFGSADAAGTAGEAMTLDSAITDALNLSFQ